MPSDQLDKTKTRAWSHFTPKSGCLAYAYLLAVLAGSLLLSLLLHPPHDTQHWLFDLVTSTFSKRLNSQHQSIVLVYVSAATLPPDHYPYLSPIDRGLLARLIGAIDDAEAKVIGFDIILDRPTVDEKDRALRTALRHTNKAKIVLGAIDEPETGSHFQSEFFCAKGDGNDPAIGHLYFDSHRASLVVSDHVIRFMAPSNEGARLSHGAQIHTSFAQALAQAYGAQLRPEAPYIDWLLPPNVDIDWLLPPNVDKHFNPRPEYKAWVMPSRHEVDPFLTVPAEDVLAKLPPVSRLLRDRIVIIGVDFDDRDQHLTPLSVRDDDFYTGAFIHAQILAQLLDGRSIHKMNSILELFVAVAIGYAGYWVLRNSGHHHLWPELLVVLFLIIASLGLFVLFRVVLPYNLLLLFLLAGAAIGHYCRIHAES